MEWIKTISKWVFQITEVGLALVALAIVLQILFGANVAFLGADVVGNLIALIRALGDNGLVGLIALAVILYLYNRARAA